MTEGFGIFNDGEKLDPESQKRIKLFRERKTKSRGLMMTEISTVFLEQSYKDCREYLKESIKSNRYESWDFIVLTASNEAQAKNYRLQIAERLNANVLDPKPQYLVVPDRNGERVGSGGATLNVLAFLKETYHTQFQGKKILLIHSGGDSKRIPQYSAVGKLFSPVPRALTNTMGSTLFDELIATSSIIPSRMEDGVMVMSGDVMLLFNPLQVDFKSGAAAAVSVKENVETGKNHGVFLVDEKGELVEFLHKKTVEELTEKGAVSEKSLVDIDTGIILFNSQIAEKFVSLLYDKGKIDEKKRDKYVNSKIRLSFYGDFLYPFSNKATLEEYMNQESEGEACAELYDCRKILWNIFSAYNMKVMSVSPAEFLHFGTTKEQLNLVTKEIEKYKYLEWSKSVLTDSEKHNCAIYQTSEENSLLGDDCYLENSVVRDSIVGSGSVLSYVNAVSVTIPERIVFSGLKLADGKYTVRFYGTEDDPKRKICETSFLEVCLREKLNRFGFSTDALGGDVSLWDAKLYPVADSIEEALQKALRSYAAIVAGGREETEYWLKENRKSLKDSFNECDPDWLIAWQNEIGKKIILGKAYDILRDKKGLTEFKDLFKTQSLENYIGGIEAVIPRSDYSSRTRFYYFLSKLLENRTLCTEYEEQAFQEIAKCCKSARSKTLRQSIKKHAVDIQLPARVNWGGGWTDTPPYCVEQGGTVLNCALKIKGEFPIRAYVRKLDERKIILESLDSNKSVETTSRDAILCCNNPFDPVALQKACLTAMGIVNRKDDQDLKNVFDILRGGLKLSTEVVDIPRGSGLGTSSILAGACVKAIYEAMTVSYTEETVSKKVLEMEQRMSTGGGWQDQLGGLSGGIKLISSQIGEQYPVAEHVKMPAAATRELNERFALIYTGQRRLARNLLRDVIGGYLTARESSVRALKKIERLALTMRRELERGDIDAFAELLNEHWEYSKLLDSGSTNTCIDYIFAACEDLLAGKMICGAGGGGFLQVILKKGIQKESLQRRITEIFGDAGVSVWESQLILEG